MSALESAFEFLFKYRRFVFESGDVAIGSRAMAPLVLASVAIALGFSLWSYRRLAARSRLRRRDVILLAGLRVLAILFAGLALLEPTLRVLTVAPQQSFVGVLLDDSQSLTIKDDRGALEQKFKLRFFRFSDSAERVRGGSLDFAGTRTNLASVLRHAKEELADVPVSGLVLISDGADNVSGPLSETLLDLRTQ